MTYKIPLPPDIVIKALAVNSREAVTQWHSPITQEEVNELIEKHGWVPILSSLAELACDAGLLCAYVLGAAMVAALREEEDS